MSKQSIFMALLCGLLVVIPLCYSTPQGSSTIPMTYDPTWTWELNEGDRFFYKLETLLHDHLDWGWVTTYFGMEVNRSWEYDTPQFSAIQLNRIALNTSGDYETDMNGRFFWSGDYKAEIFFHDTAFYAHSEDIGDFTAIPIIVPLNSGSLDLTSIKTLLGYNVLYNMTLFNSLWGYYDTMSNTADTLSLSDTIITDRYADLTYNEDGIVTYLDGRHGVREVKMTLVNQTEARDIYLPPKVYYKQVLNNVSTNAFFRVSGFTFTHTYTDVESHLGLNGSVSQFLIDKQYWGQLSFDQNRMFANYSNFRNDSLHYAYMENRSSYFWREVNLFYYANSTNGTALYNLYHSIFTAAGLPLSEIGFNYVRFYHGSAPFFAYIEVDNATGYLTRYTRMYNGDLPYTMDTFLYNGDFNETQELLNVTFGLGIGDSLVYKFLRLPSGYNRPYFRYKIVDSYIQAFTSINLGYSTQVFKVLVAQHEYWSIENARWLAYPNWDGELYVNLAAANTNISYMEERGSRWLHPINPVFTHAKILSMLPTLLLNFNVGDDENFDFNFNGQIVNYTFNNQTGIITQMNLNFSTSGGRLDYEILVITEAELPNNYYPTANFSVIVDEFTVFFNSTSISENTIVSYAWDFGDNGTGRGALVNHTYAVAGDYNITLTITDSNGDISTIMQTITVLGAEPISPIIWVITIVGIAGAVVLIWVIIRSRKISAGAV